MERWPEALVQIDEGAAWLALDDRADDVRATRPDDVAGAIDRAERLARERGWHAAGFVTFEAGAAFGLAARASPDGLPLVWFGLYRTARRLVKVPAPAPGASWSVAGLAPSMDRSRFDAALARIRKHLRDGDTYQVNFTFSLNGTFIGDARALWLDLVRAQGCRYGAFLKCDDTVIASASPELFIRRHGHTLLAKPMKGTAPRGRTRAEDDAAAAALAGTDKTRAENVMIVDMVRNDLGRVAHVGSVRVVDLCVVERYPGVLQMVSTVEARSRAPLAEVFAAAHPSASVTGAPKVATMAIIAALEDRPRGVYTGAVGYISPAGDAQFNVAIRTAVVDERTGALAFGVGAGIVWDSSSEAEYDECLLKGRVLTEPLPVFSLLETLRWRPGCGFVLIDRHLARLAESAARFGYDCDLEAARRALEAGVAGRASDQRVRLLVSEDGAVRVEASPIELWPRRVPVRLAPRPIDVSSPFVCHKTTCRRPYEDAAGGLPGEVVFWTPDGHVTESTNATVVVEIDGALVTPPVSSGLLAGTARAAAIARGRVRERAVTVGEFRSARRAWLLNSVRGWRRAALAPPGV